MLLANSNLTVSIAAPSLNLTPEERRAYGQLFRQADTGNAGIVTGEVAVNFFDKTKLDSRVLGEVSRNIDLTLPRYSSVDYAQTELVDLRLPLD